MNRLEKIINALKAQTDRRINDPELLAEWVKENTNLWVELEGKDKDYIYVILKLLTPYLSTNDQRTATEYYHYMNKEYRITYFDNYTLIERRDEV